MAQSQLAKAAKGPKTDVALIQNRESLLVALDNDADYVRSLTKNVAQGEFQTAIEELAGNSYLMEKIPAQQIVRVAAQATSMGLSVNPLHKECDILPFSVKGRGVIASIVAKKKGVQEMAFRAGFFFDVDPVWSIPNLAPLLPPEIAVNLPPPPERVIKAESEMTREELIELDPSDPKFFKENMKGWDFTLKDISDPDVKTKVQDQRTFVSLKDAIAVTGAMQATEHSLKQAYVHKAIRRAMTEFYVPRHRNQSFLQMIKIDDENAIEVEVESRTVETSPASALPSSPTVSVAKPDPVAEKLFSLIETASSLDELRMSHKEVGDYDGADFQKVRDAYNSKKEILVSQLPPKTYAQYEEEINKSSSEKAVKGTLAIAMKADNINSGMMSDLQKVADLKITALTS